MIISEEIDKLKKLVSDEVNENKIIESGEKILENLRNSWKTKKYNFSQKEIATLKELNEKLETIKSFKEDKENFQYIATIEEANDIINKLNSTVKKIEGLKVSNRIKKEIRELIEKKSNLPTLKTTKIKKNINKLDSNPPKCNKCGKKMTLREANDNFFWGCSTFPKCWNKKCLSHEELNELFK